MRSSTTILAAVLLGAVLVTAGVVGTQLVSDGATAQTDAASDRTITVDANGQVQTEADQARIDIAVETRSDSVTDARSQLSENVSQVRAALADMGIDDDQVVTEYYDINQDRRRPVEGREEQQTRYRARHSLRITLENTSRAGAVIDTAVTNGANDIDGVEFGLSRESRQDLRQDALAEAMESARTEAGTIAESADLAVTGVASVDSTQVDRRPVQYEAAELAGDDGGTEVESGPVTVSASVQVVYNATDG